MNGPHLDEGTNACHFCFISSFHHGFNEKYRQYQQEKNQADNLVNFLYLHDRAMSDVLPDEATTNELAQGANKQCMKIDEKVVDRFHRNGQIVCCWFDKKVVEESEEIWTKLMQMEVDMVCTDLPL